jgi:hypothetical protein
VPGATFRSHHQKFPELSFLFFGGLREGAFRARASRFTHFLVGVPDLRTAPFRHSATKVGVDELITIATSSR